MLAIKTYLQEASLRAIVSMQTQAVANAERVADRRGLQAIILAPAVVLGTGGTALAAGCNEQATTKLIGLINSAAKFLLAIGGALALLCFVVGGILIMIGGTAERVAKGKKLVTNTLIGLAIMAAGAFLKLVILSFVSGGTNVNTDSCIKKGDNLFS